MEKSKIKPSEKCPKCGAWTHPADLAANNGVCLVCYPAAGALIGLYDKPKEVKRG